MTDLTPNDLSHLSDKDFNALCPQGHHAPGAEPLSLAAQAVKRDLTEIMQELSRYCRVGISSTDALPITLETNDASLQAAINTLCAVALRAAADQVVPASLPWHRATCNPFAGQIRAELLAIAAELEGQ